MDKRTNKVINEYLASVSIKYPMLKKAYLFGSYAKRTERVDSDIDIALILENFKDDDRFDLQVKLMILASDFDLRIEPHPISINNFNINYPMFLEIVKLGVELHIPK